MKKRVSANLRIGRFFIIPALLILIYTNIQFYTRADVEQDQFSKIVIPLLSITFFVAGYYLFRFFDNARIIHFGDSQMYVSDKRGEEVIPIGKVISLMKTNSMINKRRRWRITYLENGIENSVIFLPRVFNLYMNDFAETILNNNKKARIQNLYNDGFRQEVPSKN